MIATPDQRNKALAEVEGGDMNATKERKRAKSETDEVSLLWKEVSILGTLSPDPWDFSL